MTWAVLQKPIQKLIDDLVEHREKKAAGDGSGGTKKKAAAKRKPESESDENEVTKSPEKKKQVAKIRKKILKFHFWPKKIRLATLLKWFNFIISGKRRGSPA